VVFCPKRRLQALLAGSFCCLLLFPPLGYGDSGEEELVEECKRLLSEGEAEEAERLCQEALTVDPENCEARYGLLLARARILEELYSLLFGGGGSVSTGPGEPVGPRFLLEFFQGSREVDEAVTLVVEGECSLSLDKLPVSIGAEEEPYLAGELRGTWRVPEALLIGALTDQAKYLVKVSFLDLTPPVLPLPEREPPLLPPDLALSLERFTQFFARLLVEPGPEDGIVTWRDADGNGVPSLHDRLVINLFKPGTDERVIDLSNADLFFPE